GEIGDQIVELAVGDAASEAGHQALAELLVDLLDLALPERMKLIVRVADLDREGILVDARAADDASVGGGDLHGEILGEAAARNEREAARQRLGRTDHRLLQVTRTALNPDHRQVGAEASALAADDVARGAAEACVDGAAALGVASRGGGAGAAERRHIADDLRQLGLGEAADTRHAPIRNAV